MFGQGLLGKEGDYLGADPIGAKEGQDLRAFPGQVAQAKISHLDGRLFGRGDPDAGALDQLGRFLLCLATAYQLLHDRFRLTAEEMVQRGGPHRRMVPE